MEGFDHILQWELKKGSHEFPGPQGGTCINEAAIVAAGFEYQAVKSAEDCPPCFCPVLSAFAIVVNDFLREDERNALLMPLVTRLAGSNDAEDWVPRARAGFIMAEVDREVVTPAMRSLSRQLAAMASRDPRSRSLLTATEMSLARPDAVLGSIEDPHLRAHDAIVEYARALIELYSILKTLGPQRFPEELDYRAPLQWLGADSLSETCVMRDKIVSAETIWQSAALALTRAFRIGTQAPVADTAQVVERMETVKARARELATTET
jgi:hypothetical protein